MSISSQDFLSKKVAQLIEEASLKMDRTSNKGIVLKEAAQWYYSQGIINEETYNMVLDDRFQNLFKAKVGELRELLSGVAKDTGGMNKRLLVETAYKKGLNFNSQRNTVARGQIYSPTELSESIVNTEEIKSSLTTKDGNLYITDGKVALPITNKMIVQLVHYKLMSVSNNKSR